MNQWSHCNEHRLILLEISMFVSRFEVSKQWGQHSLQPAFINMYVSKAAFLVLLTAAQEILNGVMYKDCRL